MKRAVRTVLIWLLAAAALTQSVYAAGVDAVSLNQVRQNGTDLTAYVTLQDAAGDPVVGSFAPESFAISVDGQRLSVDSVKSFDPNTEGIHYVFAVDTSGSMMYVPTVMQNVPAALNAFVDNLGPLDTVSIITFGSVINQLIINSGDHEAIKAAIGQIVANENNTALYKGVRDAVDIANSGAGRSAVVVITDGTNDPTPEMQGFTKDSIYEGVVSAQVPLYCIGISDSEGLYPNSEVDRESLDEFANITGGKQYIITSDATGTSLDQVFALTRNAIEMHATLTNPDGRTDFGEASTFKVGYLDGGVIASNDLQQTIDWAAVPAPAAEVTPAPALKLSLELDDSSKTVNYTPGAKTELTGLIVVEQGSAAENDLLITVNDEPWSTTLRRNGSDYTFRAEGLIPDGVDQLNVCAIAEGGSIASRVQTVEVLVPTATPAPALAMQLDDPGRDIQFESGKVVPISGMISTQGQVTPDDMQLFVNGAQCKMDPPVSLQSGQYEFSADVTLPQEAISELRVQIVLKDGNVRSPVQILPLVAPTPVPDPELGLTLNTESIQYASGQPLKLQGNIEIISGQVDQEDLALYVNSARWDMTLTPQGDDTYSFEATPKQDLVGDITKLDVKVRLASNTNVVSEPVSVAVTTPEPEATPTPTPRPTVTAPPTAEPTKVPAPTPTAEPKADPVGDYLYYYIGGGAALLLILLLIIILVVKKKKKNDEPKVMPTGFTTIHDDSQSLAGTVRSDVDTSEGEGTVMDGTVQGGSYGSAFIGDEDGDTDMGGGSSGGTVSLNNSAGGTVRLDEFASAGSGTVRLDDETEASGTVRLEEHWELVVTVEESRRGESKQHTLHLPDDGTQTVLGRSDTSDLVIDDSAVSGRHLAAYFDGESLFIQDLGSTNGTKVNNAAIAPQEPRKLDSGDQVRIGHTTLTFRFGEPDLW